jgi:hypothetical protein
MFKDLLKQILDNSPLVLSDSTEPIYVSMNRIMIAIEFVFVILFFPPFLLFLKIKFLVLYDSMFEVWKLLLTAFGVHLSINAFKKK